MSKIYPFGYSEAAIGMMQGRTAEAAMYWAALPERLEREASDPASFTGTTYVEVVARKPRP
jgi:hypothetical protein